MTKEEVINYMYENHVHGDFSIEEMAENITNKKSTEELILELEWFKSELIAGNKVIEYYQAQVDVLTRAIKMLKSTLE